MGRLEQGQGNRSPGAGPPGREAGPAVHSRSEDRSPFRPSQESPMTTDRACVLLFLVLACSAPPKSSQAKTFPAGSEKAVHAVRDALPDAQVEGVERSQHFGAESGDSAPLLWSVKYRSRDEERTIEVTPEGAILFLSLPV